MILNFYKSKIMHLMKLSESNSSLSFDNVTLFLLI